VEIAGLIIAGVMSLVFGVMVVANQPHQPATRFFFVLTVGIALWALGIAAFLATNVLVAALIYLRIYYIGAALIAVAMISVAAHIGSRRTMKWLPATAWVLFSIVAAVIVVRVDWLIAQVVVDEHTVVIHPIGYFIYMAYFILLFLAALVILAYQARRRSALLVRSQLRLISHAYGIAGGVGMVFNLLLPAVGRYDLIWAGPLSTFIFIPLAYLTIVKHRLFGLKDAAVRTIAYAMLLSLLAIVYYAATYIISAIVSALSGHDIGGIPGFWGVLAALFLGFLFQPTKQFFDRLTDKLFYRQDYTIESFINEIGQILLHTMGLRLLTTRLAACLTRLLKARQVIFAVYDDGRFRIFGSRGHTRPPQVDLTGLAVQHQIEQLDDVAVVESLPEQLRRTMKLQKLAIVMTLSLQEDIVGFVLIGESQKNNYVERDLSMLRAVRGELAIAIKNAQSMEEVNELNAELQQRVEAATQELRMSNQQLQRLDEAKNEFISMASHQLRTPLTSIKGYLDMLLQGDLGPVRPTQKAVLREAFSSSERMVQLINDFLSISRLQTGTFTMNRQLANLGDIVQSEMALLKIVAKQHNITLSVHIDDDIPTLPIDAEKLRQVIMNMIDNAIFYSKERTTVKVSLCCDTREVVFTVEDQGIGVPKAEQSGVFGKFFRASNARKRRPDGTGVGLFLARKVVLEHGGAMIFTSKENKGSTFGFRLPLDRPAVNKKKATSH
jgi:sensor protein resE